MRWLALLALFPCALAADSWVKFTSGPFEAYTDAGSHAGREALIRFEEFRIALAHAIGSDELTTPEPVRILVFKNGKGWLDHPPLTEGRNCYGIALEEKSAIQPETYRALLRLFLNANTARMPAAYEHGLEEFFSTFEVNGIHVTAGAPPAHPDLDWARMHLLLANPEYFGKAGVLLYNLRNGVPEDTACRNSLGKTREQLEAEAKQHLAAGHWEAASLYTRPMSERDLPERPVSDADARLARADLLAGSPSAAEYRALLKTNGGNAEAEEGLGLLALRDGRKEEAQSHFSAAMEAGSSSARCYIEYAKLETDRAKAEAALMRALGINSKLDEPFALLAARDTDPQKRLAHWKAAADRNPRNAAYWYALAECYLAEHNYPEAAKALTAGEQAAVDPAERERLRAARASIEQQRIEYETAERTRRAEEDAHEIQKLKDEALAGIHAAEEKLNKSDAPLEAKPLAWWDGPAPSGKIAGTLRQVDCLGSRARLSIETDGHATVKLLVSDASKVAINQPGRLTLACGAQKPNRVSIEYFPKDDAQLSTKGEVASIEFQ